MKKMLGFIALTLLLVLPLKVNAAKELSGDATTKDANGVIVASIYMTYDQGDVETEGVSISLNAQHAIIESVTATNNWTKDEASSMLSPDGSQAILKVIPPAGSYTGTGEKIKVGEVRYRHDESYTGSDPCQVLLSFDGSNNKTIVEKTTPQVNTGSVIPYIGIIAGIGLIATAFVVSRSSNKLYRM